MARPIKKGLDYFPVDTNILRDLKIRRVKREYGAESFLLYMTILCDIYANGYYLAANDDYLFDLSEQVQIPESRVLDILLLMVDVGLFDSTLFVEKRVLTSLSVQKRYFLAKTKKPEMFDSKERSYLLMGVNELITPVISPKTPVICPETPQKEGLSTQRKEKENKIKINTNQTTLTPFVPQASGREQWEIWKNELLEDEDWRASAVRQSGEGIGFNEMLPGKLNEFCDFIVSSGEQDTVGHKKDFTRRFHYWQSNHGTKKNFARAAQPERKSKIQEAIELGKAVTENAKRLGLI